jgi:hypothetical protein
MRNIEMTHLKHVTIITVALVHFFLSSIFDSASLASQNKTPDETQIIALILEEGKKEINKRNHKALKQIRDFAYQKLRGYAQKDKEFAKELIFDIPENLDKDAIQYIATEHVGIEPFGDGDFLLTVSTAADVPSKQDELYFFLIHNKKSNWIPIQFDLSAIEEGKPRSFSGREFKYKSPLLTVREVIPAVSCRVNTFILQDGFFKLLSIPTRFLKETFHEDLEKGLEPDNDDYWEDDITYVNAELIEHAKSCGPKNATIKDDMKLWKTIYFARFPQVYFHGSAVLHTKKKSYVVKGDMVCATEIKGSWIFAYYCNPKNRKTTSGWVKMDELVSPSQEYRDILQLLR